jgi:calcineurin-like phosphoesterase family protein
MSFFKMPKLDVEGKLSQVDAMNIYQHYLTTERKNFDSEVVRPVRSAIYKAMCAVQAKQMVSVATIVQKQIDEEKRLLFWSDQHFSHNNIIKFSGRPFESVEHMNISMLQNYYNCVTDNDVVVFGGDIAFGSMDIARPMVSNLLGKKVLVLGNHEFDKKNEFRNYHIFEATTMCFVFYKKINNKICNVIVTHYPIDNKWLPENTINIHGHIHVHLADKKNINMAVEHLEYRPKDLSEQIEQVFTEHC